MRLKNLLISLVVVGLAGYGALKLYVFYRAKQDFQQILYCMGVPRQAMNMPPKSRLFDYDHITASIFGPIGIKGLVFRIPPLDEEIHIGEISFTYDYDGDLKTCPTPRHVNLSMQNMTVNVSLIEKFKQAVARQRERQGLSGQAVPELVSRLGYTRLFTESNDLRGLGYKKLDIDMSVDWAYNKKDKSATTTVYEKVKHMGDVTFAMTVADLAKNIDSAVLGVKIKQARMEYHDDSYISRLYKVFAKQDNMDVAAFRKQLVDNLTKNFQAKNIKLGKDSINNLKNFLRDPKQLIVTMYPYEPVGVQSIKLYKPGDIPMLLNLQVYTR